MSFVRFAIAWSPVQPNIMPFGQESLLVAIAGATSLRGKDLKLWMEESGFPAGRDSPAG